MKSSKNEVESSILFFAKMYGHEENYKKLMGIYVGLPKIVEMISYELFLHKFNSYHCTDEQYENYKLVHEYAIELNDNGFVEFDKK